MSKKISNIFMDALNNYKKSQVKNAKILISRLNNLIKDDSEKGCSGTYIHYNKSGLTVKKECLDYMKEYYEALNFKVEVSYPSNIENNRDKEFRVWWSY